MKFVELATKSLRTIGAIGQGVALSANDLQVAFEAANDMIDAWAAVRLTIFQQLNYTYPLVAGQGSPTNPYTIGLGGDFNQPRPTWIADANLKVLTSTDFEYPLDILQPNEYARIAIKTLPSAMATALFYDGGFPISGADTGLGNIYLYPVPNGGMSLELVLYMPVPMTGFADVSTTEYTFPKGYAEALRYQLAKRLASEFGKELDQATQQLCIDTFAIIQRNNGPMPNLRSDFGVPGTNAAAGLYNWRTGQNSRSGAR